MSSATSHARSPVAPLLALGIALAGAGPQAASAQALSADEEAIARYVDEHAAEAVALLERVVNINSGTLNVEGVREVGEVFWAELEALGFDVRWEELPPEMKRAGHLFAERTGTQGRKLLLIGHLDTVFEPGDPFQTFSRDGSVAAGPGVDDMKGGDVVMILALQALASVGALDGTAITVALIGDEERPGDPQEVTRRPLVEAGRTADVALGFEGGVRDQEGDWGTVARRSASGWKLEVEGRQGHSSQIFGERLGAGALFEAARILAGFYEEVRGEQYLTFNAGAVVGGTEVTYDDENARGSAFGKSNVVPQSVVVTGGIRTISDEQLDRAREAMRAVVARHLPGTSARITFSEGYPAMAPVEGNYQLLEQYSDISEALGYPRLLVLDPGRRGAADISFVAPHVDAALAGLGAVGENAHSPGETVDLESIPVQAKRAALLIYRLTRGGPAS